jgi:DNA (cytosine-5)-methyltransferase 1
MQLHYPNLEMPKDFTGSIADLPLSINSKTLASPKTLKRYDNTITAFLVLESKKLGNQFNIMEVERIPNDLDLLTYSFPCQDLSVQGKRAGMVEKETRSGLV